MKMAVAEEEVKLLTYKEQETRIVDRIDVICQAMKQDETTANGFLPELEGILNMYVLFRRGQKVSDASTGVNTVESQF